MDIKDFRAKIFSSLAGQEIYSEVMASLPDGYFKLSSDQQELVLGAILQEFRKGERDALVLARVGAQAMLLS